MAKFGQLFLNRGLWQDKRIISEDWVRESTRRHAAVSQNVGYGYQWWTREIDGISMFYADGYGGQHIMVVDEYNMVIITTASYTDTAGMSQQRRNIWGLVQSFILPAVVQ
jgi:CubicO group peptidase (beta-lactamase class C family)